MAKQDIQGLLNRFPMFEVRESFTDYMARAKKDNDEEIKIIRKAPLIELTLEEMNANLIIEGGTDSLLERLEVSKVIAAQNDVIGSEGLFPVTRELIYNYDFGDNWIVTITKYKDCNDLLEGNVIDNYELEEAEETVLNKYKPVCINKDGISVLDDVGGLGGYADFLGTIYEGKDKEESSNLRAWAKSLGWNTRKVANKSIL